ncbi:Ger(x)C family spore germination protein [Paenibacillus qinlingensis]|uniref:Ger(x)C family spore germination protein n=1 Tax=Paenibacillus qinlingensis TaxID=1837343 RepID=UPI00156381C5|nr:Ger(x)C family spore germination protein [Paenibacillus qinlingensis]NQX60635.1 Ger(x)C family spore germination protein [Paenibacillus qinlingensis]
MSRYFFLLGLICFLLTGCVKQQTLEKITISFVCALDEAPDDQIEFTIAAPKFQAGKSSSVSNILYSKVGHTTRNMAELMDMQLSRPIKPGSLSVIIIGQELAAKGLIDELDVFLRDAVASRRMYLAVVDGKAKEILKANFTSNEEKGMFLYNLLDTNVRNGLVPRQNLHDFEYSYWGQGMDPFLPVLNLQNNQVMITGLALFKHDKYLMSVNEKQMRVMNLLLRDEKYGTLEAKLDNGSYIAVKNVGSKVNYRVGKDSKSPKVTINLSLKGEIIDSKSNQLSIQEQGKIKDLFEKDLTSTGMDLIQICKKEGIDPLGLGDFVRSKTRNWNEEEWKQEYQMMNVKLIVKVTISEMGIRK